MLGYLNPKLYYYKGVSKSNRKLNILRYITYKSLSSQSVFQWSEHMIIRGKKIRAVWRML